MASDLAEVIQFEPRDRRRVRKVMAVVLEDGTVRRMDGKPMGDGADWNSGQLTGPDWVLWWQRRSFDPE